MNFGTGAAGTRVAHFPEIILFIPQNNALLTHDGFPQIPGFLVKGNAVFLITLEDGDVQAFFG